MVSIFMFHGIEGHPEENWFGWLKRELENQGHSVFVPAFPNSQTPLLREWLDHFEQYGEHVNRDSIFVGHSLGVAFLLALLESHTIDHAFLVAGFASEVGNKFDPKMSTFTRHNFDWQKIKQNCSYFTIFHSDNDPYVAIEKAEELSENLNTEVTVIQDAGHFNKPAGYTKFPLLLEKITPQTQRNY